MKNHVADTVRSFIIKEFLPGEKAEDLTEDLPLISGGILDSIATLKLVMFLEEHYRIGFEAHEVDKEHFDTIARIVGLVESKLG